MDDFQPKIGGLTLQIAPTHAYQTLERADFKKLKGLPQLSHVLCMINNHSLTLQCSLSIFSDK